jgi:hypothetical protein
MPLFGMPPCLYPFVAAKAESQKAGLCEKHISSAGSLETRLRTRSKKIKPLRREVAKRWLRQTRSKTKENKAFSKYFFLRALRACPAMFLV